MKLILLILLLLTNNQLWAKNTAREIIKNTKELIGNTEKFLGDAAAELQKTEEETKTTDANAETSKNDVDTEEITAKKEIKKDVLPFQQAYYKTMKSVFLPDTSITVIQKALVYYNRSQKNSSSFAEEEFRNEEGDTIDPNIGIVYLRSIMYLSPERWSVWINDTKVSNENNGDEDLDFKVLALTRQEVKLLWKITLAKWEYVNKNNKISPDEYSRNDRNEIEMILTLYPNQSYVSAENTYIDGKYRGHIEGDESSYELNPSDIKNNIIMGDEVFSIEELLSPNANAPRRR